MIIMQEKKISNGLKGDKKSLYFPSPYIIKKYASITISQKIGFVFFVIKKKRSICSFIYTFVCM